ncbi:MAG: HU family DNA-binding protein [Planctomycetota bacterium]
MNKSELVDYIAKGLESSHSVAEKTLNLVIEGMTHGLNTSGDIQLVGFGSFKVKERAARKGRNPATGEELEIPASKTVKFKPGKALKDVLA